VSFLEIRLVNRTLNPLWWSRQAKITYSRWNLNVQSKCWGTLIIWFLLSSWRIEIWDFVRCYRFNWTPYRIYSLVFFNNVFPCTKFMTSLLWSKLVCLSKVLSCSTHSLSTWLLRRYRRNACNWELGCWLPLLTAVRRWIIRVSGFLNLIVQIHLHCFFNLLRPHFMILFIFNGSPKWRIALCFELIINFLPFSLRKSNLLFSF